MQYTIRNIPAYLDRLLRKKARERGASLNDTVLELLAQATGSSGKSGRRRDLSDLAGAWEEDPEFDRALREQHRVDESLWR
jgi:hypothetical protein